MQNENKQILNKETWVLLFNHTPKGGDINDGMGSIDVQDTFKTKKISQHTLLYIFTTTCVRVLFKWPINIMEL